MILLAVTLGGQKRLLAKGLPKPAFRLGKSGFY